MDPEPAEQTEMHMADLAGRPLEEQMLAPGVRLVEHGTVDAGGIGAEASLRARHGDPMTPEPAVQVSGMAVERVPLGHVSPRRSGRR